MVLPTLPLYDSLAPFKAHTKGNASMSSSVPPSFPPPNQAPLPPGKKPNILLWILGGFVVLMIGVTAMCGLGGLFLMRKAKQAGFESGLISSDSAYAAVEM